MFKKIAQQLIYQDNWLKFYKDEVQFPDNSKGIYAWVNRKPGVVIVVVNDENKLLLNKEYRYVIDDYDWEVPGGGIDIGESPEVAAIREVKEECGIEIEKLEQIGEFYPLNSFNTEKITAFLARTHSKTASFSGLESSESIVEQGFFTIEQILRMIDCGEISDAMTANVVQIAIRMLNSLNKI